MSLVTSGRALSLLKVKAKNSRDYKKRTAFKADFSVFEDVQNKDESLLNQRRLNLQSKSSKSKEINMELGDKEERKSEEE